MICTTVLFKIQHFLIKFLRQLCLVLNSGAKISNNCFEDFAAISLILSVYWIYCLIHQRILILFKVKEALVELLKFNVVTWVLFSIPDKDICSLRGRDIWDLPEPIAYCLLGQTLLRYCYHLKVWEHSSEYLDDLPKLWSFYFLDIITIIEYDDDFLTRDLRKSLLKIGYFGDSQSVFDDVLAIRDVLSSAKIALKFGKLRIASFKQISDGLFYDGGPAWPLFSEDIQSELLVPNKVNQLIQLHINTNNSFIVKIFLSAVQNYKRCRRYPFSPLPNKDNFSILG